MAPDIICTPFQEDHITRITKNEERSKSNTHQINEMKPMLDIIHKMNTNIEVMAKEMGHQNTNMDSIMTALIKTQEEVDDIKDRMETKDVVRDVLERVDTLEKIGGNIALKAWITFGSLTGAIVVGYIIAKLN